ncbi:MAG: NAD(P)H-dependent oxidoreductase [Bacteroidales bacterium]
MKFLIVYTNHHHGNFNEKLLERIKNKIINSGHELVVRDLYQINFNPVLTTRDFEMISAGQTPDDISKEQDFIKWADAMIYIYPVWWGSMPAITKGYIDRVFSWGFAYKTENKAIKPLLTDKKAILMNTLGQSKQEYEKGMFAAMNLVNSEGIFGFCGVRIAEQVYFPSIHSVNKEELEKYFRMAENVFDKMPVLQ